MRKPRHYINNRTLFEVMKKYHGDCALAKQNNTQDPKIPDYVGESLMRIATKLSNKPNFCNYSYKDEMICDGIENCIMHIKNFNPERSQNPFAYFTQIINNAFIRRIKKEKKEHYIKIKNMQQYDINDEIMGIDSKKTKFNEITDSFIKNYEQQLPSKKKAVKVTNSLSKFFE